MYRARRRLASGAAADALVTDGRRNEGVEGGRAVLEGDNRVLGRLGLDLDLDPDLRLDFDLDLGLDGGDVDVDWQLERWVGHDFGQVGHVGHPLKLTVSAIGESLAEHTSFGGVPRLGPDLDLDLDLGLDGGGGDADVDRQLELTWVGHVGQLLKRTVSAIGESLVEYASLGDIPRERIRLVCKLCRLVAEVERAGNYALGEAVHDVHEGLTQAGSTRNSVLGHLDLGFGLDLGVDLVLDLDLDLRLGGDLGLDLRLDGANVAGAVHRLAEVVLADILILRVVEGGDRRRETIGGRGGRGRMSSVLVLLVVRDRVVIITRATSNPGELEPAPGAAGGQQ